MVSERVYWTSLILSMIIIITITISIVLIFPIYQDYGVDVVVNAGFTIFTIAFLTWMVRVRENSTWKLVEKEVLKRISRHFGEILREIEDNFLSGFEIPRIKEWIDDARSLFGSPKNKRQMDKDLNRIHAYPWIEEAILEHYADVTKIRLGKAWEELLRAPDYTVIERVNSLVDKFQKHRDYLEHVISEYSRFINPKLMNSVMMIENALDRFCTNLQQLILSREYTVVIKRDPVVRVQMIKWLEPHLRLHIYTIIKELKEVEKLVLLDQESLEEMTLNVFPPQRLIDDLIKSARAKDNKG